MTARTINAAEYRTEAVRLGHELADGQQPHAKRRASVEKLAPMEEARRARPQMGRLDGCSVKVGLMRPHHLLRGQKLMSFVASTLLTACATTPEPTIRTVEVRVPVATSCVPNELGPPPEYPDTPEALRSAPDAAALLLLLARGRLVREQRLAEVEPTVEACRG